MSWLDDVGQLLATGAFGTLGTTLVKGHAPPQPADLTVVMPYGGRVPDRTHNGTERRFPRFQIIARDSNPEEAWNRSFAIRDYLRAFTQQTIGSTVYETIEPVGEPHPVRSDTEGRTVVVCNYEVRFHPV